LRYVYWTVGILLGLALALFGLSRLASERIEVVELHTVDENGEAVTTRLWVVDDEGYQYLRAVGDGSAWFNRMQERGEFELTRSGRRGSYTAVSREDKTNKINALMREKYTWGDTLISVLVGGRDGAIPIELHTTR